MYLPDESWAFFINRFVKVLNIGYNANTSQFSFVQKFSFRVSYSRRLPFY